MAEAELTRFLQADLNADCFSWSIDEDTIAEAERFDGKLALITNAPDLTAADTVARYKGLQTSSLASACSNPTSRSRRCITGSPTVSALTP